MRKIPVRCNYKQCQQLEKWIRKNMVRIHEERMTRDKIAEVAGSELGFETSKSTINMVCKLGEINLPHGYTFSKHGLTLKARVLELEKQVIELMLGRDHE